MAMRALDLGFGVLFLLPFVNGNWHINIPVLGVVMAEKVLDRGIPLVAILLEAVESLGLWRSTNKVFLSSSFVS